METAQRKIWNFPGNFKCVEGNEYPIGSGQWTLKVSERCMASGKFCSLHLPTKLRVKSVGFKESFTTCLMTVAVISPANYAIGVCWMKTSVKYGTLSFPTALEKYYEMVSEIIRKTTKMKNVSFTENSSFVKFEWELPSIEILFELYYIAISRFPNSCLWYQMWRGRLVHLCYPLIPKSKNVLSTGLCGSKTGCCGVFIPFDSWTFHFSSIRSKILGASCMGLFVSGLRLSFVKTSEFISNQIKIQDFLCSILHITIAKNCISM